VEAKRVGDQVHIQIRDQGSGMTEDDLRLVRDRIANPQRLDHRTTQHMGMPVVGTLAHRLGVKIEYRSVVRHGTWVDLTVPAMLLVGERAVHEPTAALASISATEQVSAWPRVPGQRRPQAPAVIFEQLATDPSRSWFQPTAGRGAAPWQESLRAAQAASAVPVTAWTPHGLPVRMPGERVFPPAGPVVGQPAPVYRDPEQVRRQMAAYQTGLGQAGRRRAANR
jgi:hypothetical protein